MGRLDGKLVALDRKTGAPVWTIQAERIEENFSITPAPVYYDGLVITGFAGADRGTRGRVKAYDADDGKLVWTFYVIPGPGEPGHETWPQDNDSWKYGGGAVWQTPAIDPELGLVYFSTGNAGPDYNGAVRAGDNLYTVSIVAVELKTGKYRWHFQQVHHDIWDYDSANPVVLMDLNVAGRARKAIVEVGKTGWAYILDRETGEPIVGIDEQAVAQEPLQATAATQPFPRGDAVVPHRLEIAPEGYRLVNEGRIFTPFAGEDPTIVKPGIWGGASWPPSSYDPVKQQLFVCASSVPGGFTGDDRRELQSARARRAVRHGPDAAGARDALGNHRRDGHDDQQSRLALSLARAVLQRHARDRRRSRVRRPQRRAAHGARLAHGRAALGIPDGCGHARADEHLRVRGQAIRARVLGRQRVDRLAARRQRLVVRRRRHAAARSGGCARQPAFRGAADAAGRPTRRAPRRPAAAPPTAGAAAPSAPAATPAADVGKGRRVFEETCVICHGEDGLGGHGGGAPLDTVPNAAFAMEIITTGRNNMPALAGY